jgi:hypothetical protein
MTTRINARPSVSSRMEAAKAKAEPEKKTRKPRTPKEKPMETIEAKAEVIPESEPPVAKTRRISKPKAEIVPVKQDKVIIGQNGIEVPEHIAIAFLDRGLNFLGNLAGAIINSASQSNNESILSKPIGLMTPAEKKKAMEILKNG